MAITYRGAGAWGGGKGARLTIGEADGNVYDIVTRVAYLEDNPSAGNGIEDITVVGNLMTITLTDSSTRDVVLPTAKFNPRGAWAPATTYAVDDVLYFGSATYAVSYPHTSGGTFDPGGNSGSGNDWYTLLFEVPALSLPTGGSTGQVLAKVSGTDYDTEWSTPRAAPGVATPAGGSTSARLLFGTTSGFGIYYGSGAPTVSAGQGSLYLRSDGSSVSTRLYINSNGSTGWVAVTTGS